MTKKGTKWRVRIDHHIVISYPVDLGTKWPKWVRNDLGTKWLLLGTKWPKSRYEMTKVGKKWPGYKMTGNQIMVLFVLLQMHMCSHPVGLDVWFFVGPHHLLPYFICTNSKDPATHAIFCCLYRKIALCSPHVEYMGHFPGRWKEWTF